MNEELPEVGPLVPKPCQTLSRDNRWRNLIAIDLQVDYVCMCVLFPINIVSYFLIHRFGVTLNLSYGWATSFSCPECFLCWSLAYLQQSSKKTLSSRKFQLCDNWHTHGHVKRRIHTQMSNCDHTHTHTEGSTPANEQLRPLKDGPEKFALINELQMHIHCLIPYMHEPW